MLDNSELKQSFFSYACKGWHPCHGISTTTEYPVYSISSIHYYSPTSVVYDCLVLDLDKGNLSNIIDDVSKRKHLHRIVYEHKDNYSPFMHIQTRYNIEKPLFGVLISKLCGYVEMPVINCDKYEYVQFTSTMPSQNDIYDYLNANEFDATFMFDFKSVITPLIHNPIFAAYAMQLLKTRFPRFYECFHKETGYIPKIDLNNTILNTLTTSATKKLEEISSTKNFREKILQMLSLIANGYEYCPMIRNQLSLPKSTFSRLIHRMHTHNLIALSQNGRNVTITNKGAQLLHFIPFSNVAI